MADRICVDCTRSTSGHCSKPPGVVIYFNPFVHTIEQNNEMLAKGWEPIITFDPRTDREDQG